MAMIGVARQVVEVLISHDRNGASRRSKVAMMGSGGQVVASYSNSYMLKDGVISAK